MPRSGQIERRPDAVAIVTDEGERTYAELGRLVASAAGILRADDAAQTIRRLRGPGVGQVVDTAAVVASGRAAAPGAS